MKMHWIVCDHDGERSRRMLPNERDSETESFTSFAKAEKRAQELAACEPGQDIAIYQCLGVVSAPVGEAKTVKWRVLP